MSVASIVRPPREGSINAIAITTAASTQQTITEDQSSEEGYWNFIADVAFYITFASKGAAVTDPDGTAVAGNGRTWLIPANTPTPFWLGADSKEFKARGTAAGTLRWYRG